MHNIYYTYWIVTGAFNTLFEGNRELFINYLKLRMIDLSEDAILILKSGEYKKRYNTDNILFSFLQESNFYYLTGVREIDFWATLD